MDADLLASSLVLLPSKQTRDPERAQVNVRFASRGTPGMLAYPPRIRTALSSLPNDSKPALSSQYLRDLHATKIALTAEFGVATTQGARPSALILYALHPARADLCR